MSANEKLQAVEDFLLREFPSAQIQVKSSAVEKTHRFQILHQGKQHCTVVLEAFLQGCETGRIAATLGGFMLAEHLREMGNTAVVVTSQGLKLEGD